MVSKVHERIAQERLVRRATANRALFVLLARVVSRIPMVCDEDAVVSDDDEDSIVYDEPELPPELLRDLRRLRQAPFLPRF